MHWQGRPLLRFGNGAGDEGLIKIASAFADRDVREQRNAEAAKGDAIAR